MPEICVPSSYMLPEVANMTLYKEGEGNSKKTYTCAPAVTRNMVAAMHDRLYGNYDGDLGENWYEVHEHTTTSGTSAVNVMKLLNRKKFHKYGRWTDTVRPTSVDRFMATVVQGTLKFHRGIPMNVETHPLMYNYYLYHNLHHFVLVYGYNRAGLGSVYIADTFSYQYSYNTTPNGGDVYGKHKVSASNAYNALKQVSYHYMVV